MAMRGRRPAGAVHGAAPTVPAGAAACAAAAAGLHRMSCQQQVMYLQGHRTDLLIMLSVCSCLIFLVHM